jgi:hypothetical protein
MRPAVLRPVLLAASVAGLCLAGCRGPAAKIGKPKSPASILAPSSDLPVTQQTVTGKAISSAARPGVVRGQVLRPPGQDPRSGRRTEAVPLAGDPVYASDLNGSVVARTVTDSGGKFTLVLPTGIHRVTEDTCGASSQVGIRGGATRSLTLAATCS